MNWGLRIALLYIGFVGMIITLVGLTMRQKVDLVSKDYYEQELKFQQKIDKMNNTVKLEQPLQWEIRGQKIVLTFPPSPNKQHIIGSVFFFRPSDATKDKIITLDTDTGNTQEIPLSIFSHGQYNMQVSWRCGNEDYYEEKVVHIP
jgi:hypothetical protein